MHCFHNVTNVKAVILHEVYNSSHKLQRSKSHPRLDEGETNGTDSQSSFGTRQL